MGKRELVALLSLSIWCLVMVVWLFLVVPWVFPDHTHLLFTVLIIEKSLDLGRLIKYLNLLNGVATGKVVTLVS